MVTFIVVSNFFITVYLELFRGYMQQDAHEFLNFLLNDIDEILMMRHKKKNNQSTKTPTIQAAPCNESKAASFIRRLFQGTLTNEMKCLCCETVTSFLSLFLAQSSWTCR